MSAFSRQPPLGVPPVDPFTSQRVGRGAQTASFFDPVRIFALAGSTSTGIRTVPLSPFVPPQGTVGLYVVGGIVASGGATVALYLYASPLVGADPLDIAVTYAAGVQNTASAWVPQNGTITYGVQLATAPTYGGYLAVAGWIRNP